MPNIFLVGPMGVGKTTIGKMLASELSYTFIDSDREIEKRAGADVSWIFDVEGEAGFRKREHAVIAELAQGEQTVIATGGGAVLNAETRKIIQTQGFTVYLKAPLKILLERTSQDKSRPLLQVEDPEASFSKILEERESLYREIANIELSSYELSSKQVISEIINCLT
jgi:shikimate kinase